ncbi:pentapeptide repeat-containing protein [Streptomyces yangpuensis]|uniref:pentapeptide repeat-containing protein n=1 Tax=Streptomyces yangpuensis TaxID=1648182 RepID=UPI0036666436
MSNLGAGSVDMRLGGIYALQRIMQDSARDQPAVVVVLSAFVRNRASVPKGGFAKETDDGNGKAKAEPPADAYAATYALFGQPVRNNEQVRVDLSRADLRGLTFDGRVDYLRLKLPDGVPSQRANASGLRFASMYGTDLRHVDFGYADLRDVAFVGANLSEALIYRTDLTLADFTDADLTKARLSESILRNATFSDATLRQAELIEADLTGADLAFVNLTGALLRGTDLTGANLAGANLSGADLTEADLTGADLTEADLSGADLTGAKLHQAQLSGAKLKGVRGLPASLRP